MQEIKEGRKASHTSPKVLFSCKDRPMELRNTDASKVDQIGTLSREFGLS